MSARWRIALYGLLMVVAASAAVPLTARASEPSEGVVEGSAATAQALSEATGLAISPLLVLTWKGAHRYWQHWREPSEDLGALPWYAQRVFWIPALVLILLVLFKEAILGRVIALKKPLDELELVENMASGLLACPVAVQALTRLLEPAAARAVAWAAHFAWPVAEAASSAGAGAGDATGPGALVWVLAATGGFILFATVWMASQAVNVLLLLSPLGIIDNLVKLGRLLLLALVVVLVRFVPAVGIAVCGLVVLAALAVAGWSFRLMVFGAVFSRDVLLGRSGAPADDGVWAFASHGMRAVPPRSYGILRRQPAGLELTYRRWLVLPARTVRVSPEHVEVAAALLGPVVVRVKDPGPYETLEQLFRLPPRYRGAEAKVAASLGSLRVRDVALLKGFKAVRAWVDALVNEGTIHIGI